MPTYEYECRACGHEFEREQRISEDPVRKCPRCGKDEVRRLISRTSFVLKGGGWYSDLYSSKPAPKADAGSGEAAAGGDKGEKAGTAGKTDPPAEKPAKTEKAEKPSKKPGGSPKGSQSAA
jgi:putative FmdB family regulatory protein